MSTQLRVRAAAIMVILALMAAVPAIALAGPRPSPWGWQMYSGQPGTPHLEVVRENGQSEPVDFTDVVAWPRPEIDFLDAVARHLCQRDSSIVTVRLSRTNPDSLGELACSNF